MKCKKSYNIQTIASKKYQTNNEAFYNGGIKPKTIKGKASLNRKRNMLMLFYDDVYGIYLPLIYKNLKVNIFRRIPRNGRVKLNTTDRLKKLSLMECSERIKKIGV